MTKHTTDWFAVRAEYIAGTMSLKDLAQARGLNHDTVRRQARFGKWTAARRAQAHRVAAELEARNVASRVTQLHEWNERDLAIAKNLRARLAMRLAKIGDPTDEDPFKDLAALESIVMALEKVQRIGRLALGATTTNSGISAPDGGPVGAAPSMTDFYDTLQAVEVVEH